MLSITERLAATHLLSVNERGWPHAQDMSLDQLIKRRRAAKGLTQRELAQRLSVSHGLVGQWETGVSKPGPMLLPVVCALLDIDMRAELGKDDQPAPQFIDSPQELALLGVFRIMRPEVRTAWINLLLDRLGAPSDSVA